MAAFNDGIQHLRHLLQLEMEAGTPADHMRVVEARIELALHFTEQGSYVEAQAELDRRQRLRTACGFCAE